MYDFFSPFDNQLPPAGTFTKQYALNTPVTNSILPLGSQQYTLLGKLKVWAVIGSTFEYLEKALLIRVVSGMPVGILENTLSAVPTIFTAVFTQGDTCGLLLTITNIDLVGTLVPLTVSVKLERPIGLEFDAPGP